MWMFSCFFVRVCFFAISTTRRKKLFVPVPGTVAVAKAVAKAVTVVVAVFVSILSVSVSYYF